MFFFALFISVWMNSRFCVAQGDPLINISITKQLVVAGEWFSITCITRFSLRDTQLRLTRLDGQQERFICGYSGPPIPDHSIAIADAVGSQCYGMQSSQDINYRFEFHINHATPELIGWYRCAGVSPHDGRMYETAVPKIVTVVGNISRADTTTTETTPEVPTTMEIPEILWLEASPYRFLKTMPATIGCNVTYIPSGCSLTLEVTAPGCAGCPSPGNLSRPAPSVAIMRFMPNDLGTTSAVARCTLDGCGTPDIRTTVTVLDCPQDTPLLNTSASYLEGERYVIGCRDHAYNNEGPILQIVSNASSSPFSNTNLHAVRDSWSVSLASPFVARRRWNGLMITCTSSISGCPTRQFSRSLTVFYLTRAGGDVINVTAPSGSSAHLDCVRYVSSNPEAEYEWLEANVPLGSGRTYEVQPRTEPWEQGTVAITCSVTNFVLQRTIRVIFIVDWLVVTSPTPTTHPARTITRNSYLSSQETVRKLAYIPSTMALSAPAEPCDSLCLLALYSVGSFLGTVVTCLLTVHCIRKSLPKRKRKVVVMRTQISRNKFYGPREGPNFARNSPDFREDFFQNPDEESKKSDVRSQSRESLRPNSGRNIANSPQCHSYGSGRESPLERVSTPTGRAAVTPKDHINPRQDNAKLTSESKGTGKWAIARKAYAGQCGGREARDGGKRIAGKSWQPAQDGGASSNMSPSGSSDARAASRKMPQSEKMPMPSKSKEESARSDTTTEAKEKSVRSDTTTEAKEKSVRSDTTTETKEESARSDTTTKTKEELPKSDTTTEVKEELP